MKGCVIQIKEQSGEVNDSVWESVAGFTIAEHTVLHALKAEYIHKVIVVAPISTRRRINGGGIFNPAINPGLKALGRTPIIHYHDNNVDPVAAIYDAALKHELDDIILMYANCPLIEPWLINYFGNRLEKSVWTHFHNFSYNNGFRISAFPFGMLVEAHLYSEDRLSPDPYISTLECTKSLPDNTLDDIHIENPPFDLRFTNLEEQHESFDFLLNELNKGADINELIGDLYDQSKKDEK